MKVKYKIINIIALLSVIIFTFAGCIADKNRPQSKKVDDTNKEQVEYQNNLKAGAGNTEVEGKNLDEIVTTTPETTTVPETTTTIPVTTTQPQTIDSLTLHKNTPEFEVKNLEETKQVTENGVFYKTNLQPYKLGEVSNIKGITLTYRVVKISKSDYEHKDYLISNNITNVYDIEIEACVKNSQTPILNILYIFLGDYRDNNFIKAYSLLNTSYNSTVSKDKISTFHILIGTNSELNGDYILILSSQNTILASNPIRYKFNSNEIK